MVRETTTNKKRFQIHEKKRGQWKRERGRRSDGQNIKDFFLFCVFCVFFFLHYIISTFLFRGFFFGCFLNAKETSKNYGKRSNNSQRKEQQK